MIEVTESHNGNVRLEVYITAESAPVLQILTPEEAIALAVELERLGRQCL